MFGIGRKSKTKVIHKPAGYRGYMDQKPIRKPNWHMIFVLVGGLFCCGAVSAVIGILTVPSLFSSPAPPTATTPPATSTPALVANVSTARPTFTPSPTSAPTNTPTATAEATPDLKSTVDAMSTNLAVIQTQTALPTATTPPATSESTPTSTSTSAPDYEQLATVRFDNVTVRSAPGTNAREITMVFYGESFGVLDERYTNSMQHNHWIRIDHPMHSSAWIAASLLDLEPANE